MDKKQSLTNLDSIAKFRCTPELMPAVQAIARQRGLTASSWMRSLVIQEIHRLGWPVSDEKAA